LSKLKRIAPELGTDFELKRKITSHFIAPFLAAVSFKVAMAVSRSFLLRAIKNPFGSELLLSFQKK
jgi:hypothetical protein